MLSLLTYSIGYKQVTGPTHLQQNGIIQGHDSRHKIEALDIVIQNKVKWKVKKQSLYHTCSEIQPGKYWGFLNQVSRSRNNSPWPLTSPLDLILPHESPFFIVKGRSERKGFSWNSFSLHLVCNFRFQADFEFRSGDTKGGGGGKYLRTLLLDCSYLDSGLFLQSTFYHLHFRVLRQLFHLFCPRILFAFNKMKCACSIFTRTGNFQCLLKKI